MSKKLVLSVMLVMAMAFTGCGAASTGANGQGEPVKEQSKEETQAAEESGKVVVKHSLGETEVPKNPKNVVVLDYGILDALDALEVQIAGVAMGSSMPAYLSKYNDENNYTNVGSIKEADMEKVFEAEPELIIIGARLADYYEELSKIAPTVQLSVDASDYMNSFEEGMTYLGQIFEKEEEVAEKLAGYKKQMAAISDKAAEKSANGLIVLTNGDSFSVYGAGSRFGLIHNEMGITPVDPAIEVSTHGQNASFEYIAEKNPDYLFVVDRMAVTASEGSAAALFNNELMQSTKAFKSDHIIYLNPTIWYAAGGGFTSTQMMIDEINNALER